MKRLLSGLALLCLFGVVGLPRLAADDPKKPDDKKPDVKKDEPKKDDPTPEKMLKAGQLAGKIIHVDESKRSLKVKLEFVYQKLNTGEYEAMQRELAYAANDSARRNFNGAAEHQRNAANHQARLYSLEKKSQDVGVDTIDKVVVRAAQPPAAFDDKGLPKKYTQKELDELKGADKKLPGYTADFGDLRAGQYITLELSRKSDTGKKPTFKTKEEEADWMMANLPKASMIVIVQEPQG